MIILGRGRVSPRENSFWLFCTYWGFYPFFGLMVFVFLVLWSFFQSSNFLFIQSSGFVLQAQLEHPKSWKARLFAIQEEGSTNSHCNPKWTPMALTCHVIQQFSSEFLPNVALDKGGAGLDLALPK